MYYNSVEEWKRRVKYEFKNGDEILIEIFNGVVSVLKKESLKKRNNISISVFGIFFSVKDLENLFIEQKKDFILSLMIVYSNHKIFKDNNLVFKYVEFKVLGYKNSFLMNFTLTLNEEEKRRFIEFNKTE